MLAVDDLIRDRHSLLCYWCGKMAVRPTLDHIIPESLGGKGEDNLVLCCFKCNQTKGCLLPCQMHIPHTGTIHAAIGRLRSIGRRADSDNVLWELWRGSPNVIGEGFVREYLRRHGDSTYGDGRPMLDPHARKPLKIQWSAKCALAHGVRLGFRQLGREQFCPVFTKDHSP